MPQIGRVCRRWLRCGTGAVRARQDGDHGEEVWPGKPLVLGVNGIALSPDGQALYWTVTTGTHAYATPTALLREPRTGSMELLAADEGVHWPDTPAIGPDGRLVFTSSNLNRHFAGQVKPGEERYELWRVSRK